MGKFTKSKRGLTITDMTNVLIADRKAEQTQEKKNDIKNKS